MVALKPLDEKTFVAGQVGPADLAAIAAEGILTIVNNRPEGEAPDQPAVQDIEAEAAKHGVAFVNLPFTAMTLRPAHVAAFAEILHKAQGPVLAYCRSGSRSTMLWAAARLAQGDAFETVAARAAQAGYDLSPASGFIHDLASMAKSA